ncbi:MAG: hypothetical protein PF485_00955 [Bacteroidales bacterium]|jgi:hypothetical protein|nr:hypothetical protein [Bacteroidales bacterium]
MKKHIIIISIIFCAVAKLSAQVYYYPIAGKQSHPELEIVQIEITENTTLINLQVTNKRDQGGWFCADKNIYIKNSKETEIYPLINSVNIPTCPNQHEFKKTNEILKFQLIFPKISDDIVFIDLIENCNNACFSFFGIILDNNHNEKIRLFEKAFDLYKNESVVEAIPLFEKVISGEITIESHIHGLSYYYLIDIYKSLQNAKKVNFWVEELKKSDLKDKTTILKELENLGI